MSEVTVDEMLIGDEAWVYIVNRVTEFPLWLYQLSSDCHKCAYRRVDQALFPNKTTKLKIPTSFSQSFRILSTNVPWVESDRLHSGSSCKLENFEAGPFGEYEIHVWKIDNAIACEPKTLVDPINIYLPIITVTIGCSLLLLLKNYGKCSFFKNSNEVVSYCHNVTQDQPLSDSDLPCESSKFPKPTKAANRAKFKKKKAKLGEKSFSTTVQTSVSNNVTPVEIQEAKKPRLIAVDAFRGLAIVIMLFVDDGGGKYWIFQHATWDGLTVADLAFPWFLWIMGVCIPLSLNCQKSSYSISKKTFLRFVKLIFLGLCVNTFKNPKPTKLENLRFPGVLQRLGVSYLVVSLIYTNLMGKTGAASSSPSKRLIARLLILGLVSAYLCIIFLLPVPNCPTGYFGPGGFHDNHQFSGNCIGGATGYLDRILLSTSHMYSRHKAMNVYGSGPFDPEGILGVLPSIFQAWLGVEYGLDLKNGKSSVKKHGLIQLVLTLGGCILCGGTSNVGLIPINKNLWSLSYVMITCAMAQVTLKFFQFLIDDRKYWSGSPLYQAGMNSMLLYLGHNLLHSALPFNYSYGLMNTHCANFIENCWTTFLWIVVGMYFHRVGMFLVI